VPRWLSEITARLPIGRWLARVRDDFFMRADAGPDRPSSPPPAPPPSPIERREPPERPPVLTVRIGAPQIQTRVAPAAEDGSIVTSFVAAWRPRPVPSEEWVRLLRSAPFGTQSTSARELRWDGKDFSIERVNPAEIEAFAAMMDEWAEYANREFAELEATPEAMARFQAQKRAIELQSRFRR